MEKQHQPVLIVIAGPNGSGKTTITSKILRHQWLEDAVYVNPDNVAQDCFGDWNLNCRLVSLMVDRTYVYDNSVDDMEAQLLFRMTNGRMLKKYTEKIPDWAVTVMG